MSKAGQRTIVFSLVAVLGFCLAAADAPRAFAEEAALKFPSIFGNNMVLQRDQPIPVWGRTRAGEKISVSLADARVDATADAEGNWKVRLPAQKAGGPHTLTVQGEKEQRKFENVLIGEVWLCSGQSNMQMAVKSATNGAQEAAAANDPQLRLFSVTFAMAPVPQFDCQGSWEACSPKTAADFSAVGYYFGRELRKELGVPVGLIHSSWGGSVCEAWMSREALAADPDYAQILQRAGRRIDHGTGMYNNMIHPLIPYGIRGTIWYQGEGNCLRSYQYRKLFPALIADWRTRWGQGDFPFYYVQLSPFGRHQTEWPELWEAQFLTLKVPNTGMAVITDIGEPRNIHPLNKQGVGHRLALWALAKTYGKSDVAYSGPLYKSMQVEGDKIRLQFDHAKGLKSRDGKPLDWFTIAGEDRQFKPATATIDGDSVVVHSSEVKAPVSIRFGWSDVAQPNLVNGADLPASPFRTDDWPAVTANAR